jgi:hypothetical protein
LCQCSPFAFCYLDFSHKQCVNLYILTAYFECDRFGALSLCIDIYPLDNRARLNNNSFSCRVNMPSVKKWFKKTTNDVQAAVGDPIDDGILRLQRNQSSLSAISGKSSNTNQSTKRQRNAALWGAYAGSREDLSSKQLAKAPSSLQDFESEMRATAFRPQNKYFSLASSSVESKDDGLVSRYGLQINTAAAALRSRPGSSALDLSPQDDHVDVSKIGLPKSKIESRYSASSSYVPSNSQVSSVNGAGEELSEAITPDTPRSQHEEISSRPETPYQDAKQSVGGCRLSSEVHPSEVDPYGPGGSKGKGKQKAIDIRDIDWSAIGEEDGNEIFQAYGATTIAARSSQVQPQASHDPNAGEGGKQKLVGRWLNNQDFSEQLEGYLAIESIERQKEELRQQWKRLEEDLAARQLDLERQEAEARARREAEEEAARLAAEAEAEAARIAAERARWRECAVCGDEKDPLDFPTSTATEKCEHEPHTCSECMHLWMASEFDTKGCDGINCPECPQTLSYAQVQVCASAETFDKYDKMATRNALGSLDEFSWCLGTGCGSGQLNIDNNCFMHCVSCGYKQCLQHKVPWHTGETCEQYEYRESGQKAKDEEKKTEAMLDGISKKCPGKTCGWRIQKTDGCDHMTCKRCRHEFCWYVLSFPRRSVMEY